MKKFILSASVLLALPVFGVEPTQPQESLQRTTSSAIKFSEEPFLKEKSIIKNIRLYFLDEPQKQYTYKNNNTRYLEARENPLIFAESNLLPDILKAEESSLEGMSQELFSGKIGNLRDISKADRSKINSCIEENENKISNIKNFIDEFIKDNNKKLSNRERSALRDEFSRNYQLSDVVKKIIEMGREHENMALSKKKEADSREKRSSSLDEFEIKTLSNASKYYSDQVNLKGLLILSFFTELFKKFPGNSLFEEPKA